jgi:effector-binding domain-containing protein
MNDLIKKEESVKKINLSNEVIIKDIEDKLIVGYRFKGKYKEVGKYFGQIGRYCHINLRDYFFSLYYEMEYKDEDADIEACGQVKSEVDFKDLKSRILTGGRAVTLIHRGSYDTIGISYKKIIDYVNNHNLNIILPIREIYIKSPGYIFKGVPENYITEIQMMLK